MAFLHKPAMMFAAFIAMRGTACFGQEPVELSGTLGSLFASEQAASFSNVLPSDQLVHWKFLQAPASDSPAGLLIFISPNSAGVPQPQWHAVLRDRNLHWIAAENFGNEKPTARRVLAAIMGLRRVERELELDRKRIYIGGMSGGGRVASTAITTFPQLFSGALYIVGADPLNKDEQAMTRVRANRYVFITGRGDFNRNEMKSIHRGYIENGVVNALFLDLRGFGHQYPNADQLNRALAFLDGEVH